MKIVIIGPAHPLRGGLASFNERLAKEFQDQGNEVIIYTFSLQYPSFLFPGTTQYSSQPAPPHLSVKICINSISPFNWIKIGTELKKANADIVVVRYWLPFMGPCLGTILRRIKKNKHTKVVCIADNIIPHEKRPADNLFTRYFIKPVDAFITMSEKVLTDLKSFSKTKKALLVPHPLYDNFGEKVSKQVARKHLGIGDNEKIILFFGFIRKYKGLDLLLEAISIIKAKHSDSGTFSLPKLLIAGEFYENKKIYETRIQQLGISENIILHTDFIPDDQVKYYLCAADVVVQPYKSATQSGVTPLAYHFEIPMIVTNVGSLPALVPDGKAGLVAEPNAVSIAEKIINYFSLTEAYFLPHLIAEKKKYSWQNMIKAILELANNK